jgi:hypothetical protein
VDSWEDFLLNHPAKNLKDRLRGTIVQTVLVAADKRSPIPALLSSPVTLLLHQNSAAQGRLAYSLYAPVTRFAGVFIGFLAGKWGAWTKVKKESLLNNYYCRNPIGYPDVQIFVALQYRPRLPVPGKADVVHVLNNVIAMLVSGFPQAEIADIFSAFEGKEGLLLIEKKGADTYQDHPTNTGYEVIAKAFADAIWEAKA